MLLWYIIFAIYMLQIHGNMLFKNFSHFCFHEQIQKFRNCPIQEVSLWVSVLRRDPLMCEIFGWKCDRDGHNQLRSVLSPGALSRRCFKGNHKKSFQGDEIAYLQMRCPSEDFQTSAVFYLFWNVYVHKHVLRLKRLPEVCSGNLDYVCAVLPSWRVCVT